MKILSLVSILIGTSVSTSGSEKEIIGKNELYNFSSINYNSGNSVVSQKVTLESIKNVFKGLAQLKTEERSFIAKGMRSDFKSFMNKYFVLDENQNKCLDTDWKSNQDLIRIIDILATTVEKQGVIGNDVKIDENGIQNAVAGRKKHKAEIKGSYGTNGVYTVSGSYSISWP